MDAPNDQDFSLHFDFAGHLRAESAVAGINAARFQRAPEGPGQSTAGRRHHIIQCGSVWGKHFRGNFVVLGDLGMDAENHWVVFDRQVSEAQGPALSLDPDP